MANQFRVKKGLIVNGSGSTILDIQGSQGQLFSVTDSLSGSLFAVKDISGIPVMEAFSDNRVNIGTFNAEAIKVSGSFAFVTGSLFGTASWALNTATASFVATASWSNNSVTASYVTGSVHTSANPALSASYAVTSSFALTASFVIGGASTIAIQDEGSAQGSAGTINFVGTGVTATVGGGIATVNIPGAGGSAFPYTGSAIISGALLVTGSVSATQGGFTGSLFGTASWAQNAVTASYVTGSIHNSSNPALSASYALTASYALNAAQASSFPFTGSAIISGALLVTGSVSATQGGFTGSLFGTSSWAQNVLTASYVTGSVHNSSNPALSSSYALSSSFSLTASYVLGGSSTINIQDEGAAQGSAGTINFVGPGVTATVAAGTATVTINPTGSTALHTQASPAVTWSFNHNLGNLYPVLNVWDSNGFMIMPGGVKTVNTNQLEIYFDIAQAGYASAVVGGTAVSASYALTASYALNAGGSGPAAATDYIASGNVTASVSQGSGGIFLIKSGSVSMFEVSGSGRFTANSSLFIIKNYTTQQPVFTVSESVVKFATQSSAPTGNADNGAFWFTGTDLYIGLN